MSTISSTISHGIILGDPGYLSPLTITGSGYLSNNGVGSALYAGYPGTILNQGTIHVSAPDANALGYYGINLAGGGTVNNSGTISGNNQAGIRLNSGGYVTNSGLISTGRAGIFDDGGLSLSNSGTIYGSATGVFARNGDATITNAGLIAGNNAVWVFNGPGFVTNTGTLHTVPGNAVRLSNGGTVSNQAGALIASDAGAGVYIGAIAYAGTAQGLITNAGTIIGSTGVQFYASNTLAQTVADSGTIIGIAGTGIGFSAGNDTMEFLPSSSVFIEGTVDGGAGTNTLAFLSATSAGTLTGSNADFVNFNTATVAAGSDWVLAGGVTFGAGVQLTNAGTLTDSGTVTNAGTITGNPFQLDGGALTNQAGGIITATSVFGLAADGSDSVLNLGSIDDGPGIGIVLTSGRVTNGAGGRIEGFTGVSIGSNGTLINAGTIVSALGTAGPAVHFGGGNARLIDDPGAVFVGSIYGGTGGTATFELASGSSAGTVSGFGSGIVNFTTLQFDAGARWTASGNGLASGLGGLTISGFELGDTIDVTGFSAVSRTFGSDSLVLTDGVGADETLTIQGSFSTAQFVITDVGGDTEISLQNVPSIVVGGTATFDGGGSPVVLDGSLTVSDAGSSSLTGATIAINSGFIAGDMLNFSNTASIIGNYDTATGVLTLTGADTLADYQAALDSITYSFSPGNGDPTGGGPDTSRSIQWVANDGTATSDPTTITLNVVHTPPTITAGGTISFEIGGTSVAADGTIGVVDVDSGGNLTSATVSIGGGFHSGDVLSFVDTPDITGEYNAATGVLTLSGTASVNAYQDALASVTFSTTSTDLTPRTLGWTVSDGPSTSTAGASTIDLILNPPTIAGTAADQATTDEAAISPFAGVSIGDPNIGQTETVTITLSDADDGTLSNLGGGTFNNGTYAVSGSASAVTQAVDGLVFTPTAHSVVPGEDVTTTFTLQVTDSLGASATDSTTSVVATAVNDPPMLTQAGNDVAVPISGTVTNGTSPFSMLTVTDPDIGHIDTVTVAMSDPAGGVFSNLSGGAYDPFSGVYTFIGTASDATAALDALIFTPAPLPPGIFVATTDFSVAVTGPGGTAGNDAISVNAVSQQVPGLDTGSGRTLISVSPDGSSFAPPAQGQANEAVVSDPTNGGAYTLPSGYQALYAGGSADVTLSDDSVGGAVLIGNSGNDTISAGASDDVLIGGAGHNTFIAGGSHDIIGVSGTSSVSMTGTQDIVYANENPLTLTDGGTDDAIGLGTGSADVTLSGTHASVYANSGHVDLTDNGTGDAIGAGTGMLAATLNGSGTRVYGSTGAMVVNVGTAASDIQIGMGGGNSTVTVGGSTTTLFGGSGPMTLDVAGSASHTKIGLGIGDAAVTVAGGNTSLFGGSGSLTADVTGNSAVFGLDGGSAHITLAGAAAQIFGGSGTLSVADNGLGDTIQAGSGNTTVTGGGQNAVVAGGGGQLDFIGGAGSATVFGGSGMTTVQGGSGPSTLYGGAGGLIAFTGGSGAVTYQALGGDERFDGSAATAGLILNGGVDAGGHDLLIGGSGNDSLCVGSGADTMSGGGGQNEFVFYKSVVNGAAPGDVITDFNADDAVYLAGYGATEAAQALAGASSSGGSTTLTLSDNTRITFLDVANVSQLQGRVVSF